MRKRRGLCLTCGALTDREISWVDLWKLEPLNDRKICRVCQKKFESGLEGKQCIYCQHHIKEGSVCFDCHFWKRQYGEDYLKQESIFIYHDTFKSWIKMYKYLGDIRQAQVMVEYVRFYYKKYQDYVWTHLPSSPQNLIIRGFNPVREILDQSKIPYQSLFDYVGNGENQAKKSRKERMKNANTFSLKGDNLNVRRVLLFDDVYTTGATLIHAKQLLFSSGVEEVMSLTLARDIMSNENKEKF